MENYYTNENMIKFRQKQYTGWKKQLGAKTQRSILNGFEKFLKSKAGTKYLEANQGLNKTLDKIPKFRQVQHNTEKGVGAVTKTVKMIPENPGAAVRRAVGGSIINPGMAAATGLDPALAVVAPAYNASPVNLKMVAAAAGDLTKSPEPIRRVGYRMMRNNGATEASRFGQRLQYNVNKTALDTNSILSNIHIA